MLYVLTPGDKEVLDRIERRGARNHVLVGARHHGFPESYVKAILRVLVREDASGSPGEVPGAPG